MSQRTRARTTGDATIRRSKAARQAEQAQAARPDGPGQQTGDGSEGQATQPEQQPAASEGAFAPETLARTLRAVAAELERDPDLARRVARAAAEPQPDHVGASASTSHPADAGDDAQEPAPLEQEAKGRRATRTFRPRLVTGLSPDLGQGVVDPFALYTARGEDGLRAALDELRLGSLRAIVREHHIDPSGKLTQQNDAEKLRTTILTAVKKRRP